VYACSSVRVRWTEVIGEGMGEVRYEGVGRGGTADFVWRPGGRGAEWGTWGDVVKQGALSPALSRGGQ